MRYILLIIYLLGFSYSRAQVLQPINGTFLYMKTVGKGEPLIVIHGGPGMNMTYLIPHLETLSKKYYLVFYDQRASGRSETPSPDSIKLSFFADDIEAIRKGLGVEKVNILCHSWGAIPAVNYAMRYPSSIKHLIFCNPVALSQEFDAEALANQQAKATPRDSTDRSIILGSKEFKTGKPEAYRKLLMLSFRHSFYNPSDYEKLRIDIPSSYFTASQALYAGLGKELAQYDFYEAIKAVSFPVLIIHGAADITPLSASTKLQATIPGSKLVVLKKCGHFAFIEQAGKFKDAVVEFLGKNRQ